MTNQDKIIFLKEIKDVLDNAGIEFWLESGTLLGVIRQGDLIENDHDMDISIKDIDKDKVRRVIIELAKIGEYGECKQFGKFISSHYIQKEDFKTDIYYWKKIGDKMVSVVNCNFVNVVPEKYFINMKEIEFKKEKFKVPNNAEQYLQDRYGKDWRIPDGDWKENNQKSLEPIEKYSKYFL